MNELTGGCHCGNVVVAATFAKALDAYQPRLCDCTFCSKHGAAYVSDSAGSLSIRIKDDQRVARYRQGNEIAQFLLCANCGVLIGAWFATDGRLYGAVNANVFDGKPRFGDVKTVSPRKLAADEKVARWKALWFADVTINTPVNVSSSPPLAR
jgi:hypothetical protein